MRRPNRAIEVFDISLMAVVTKAMGAFLVIMLLLMPYYSSGPVGEKSASDLAMTIRQTQDQLKLIADKLKQPNLDLRELERLLEEARRRLRAARALLAQLKRENDQLNAQVDRLQSQLDAAQQQLQAAQAENEKLRQELAERDKAIIIGQLINWDCSDVRMQLFLVDINTAYKDKKGVALKYMLNYPTAGPGSVSVLTEDEYLATHENQRKFRPGTAFRFSVAYVWSRSPDEDSPVLVLVSRDKSPKKLDDDARVALKRTSKECHALISVEFYFPRSDILKYFQTFNYVVPKSTYAVAVSHIGIRKNDILLDDPTPEDKAWLLDQIAHAAKAN